MLTILDASRLLNINKKYLRAFHTIDPYNDNNTIDGYICCQSGNLYGSLVIYKINNQETNPQIIYTTPKLHYPFITTKYKRIFIYPIFDKIKIYEKLDGTNICCYSYNDSYGKTYVTFKTRLSPVLTSNKFGNFKQLWDKILEQYPQLREPDVVKNKQYNLVYELYGKLNQHLITYDIDLDAKMLFAIEYHTGNIIPNTQFTNLCPLPEITEVENTNIEFDVLYTQYQDIAEQKNQKSKSYTCEGFVFYVHTNDTDNNNNNKWMLYKVKPSSIEKIHFAKSAIDYNTIYVTALNTLEHSSSLTIQEIITLLKEEFDDFQIKNSYDTIMKVYDNIVTLLQFRERVYNIYIQHVAPLNTNDKKIIMPIMAQYFNKSEMSMVYTELKRLLLVN